MTEPEPDDYSNYFTADGQPVRRGVVLTDDEQREFAQFEKYFGTTTNTEEIS